MAEEEKVIPKVDEKPADTTVEEFETYNGFKIAKGGVEAINKRVASETHNWKEKHKATEDKLNTLSVQFEEMKLSTMTDKQKQDHKEAQERAEKDALKQKASDSDSKFKTYFLETEVLKEISNYDCVNAKQVLKLIKAEYKEEFADIEDGVQVFFNNGSTKFTVQEAVKTYLDDPQNSNLLKSTLKTGSGTKTSNTQTKTNLRTTFKRSEVNKIDSDAAKEYHAAMRAGLNPSLTD